MSKELSPSPRDIKAERQLAQHKILLAIARSELVDEGDVAGSLKMITEAAAEGLGVERASVWLYNADRTAIVCVDLFERLTTTHTEGATLKATDFPSYFNYLLEERTLPAVDAHTDGATFEFSKCYLEPLNIFSMLDAPIRKDGQMIGVICNESVGQKKDWTMADQSFAGSVADIVSRVLVARDRVNAVDSLKIMNENLERLVEERTAQLEVQRASTVQSAKMASLGEMSAGIAHEINTPLATILLLAGGILESLDSDGVDEKSLRDSVTTIEMTSSRIARIVQSLRSFARDTTQDPLVEARIKDLVSETLAFCEQRFAQARVHLDSSQIPDELCVQCRPLQIQQVLLNLLNNAFDAVSALPSEKWIRISAEVVDSVVQIKIVDSGAGIPGSIRTKIMQPFFTTKTVGKGTGLGLSVSRGIMEAHHGTLTLDDDSVLTTFVITLPAPVNQAVA